ncbi:acylphosphatase [Candidatus Bathyarchaeota archaeon]|nr:acylphosphatase [Candidatus Bathyarchaeota archaeon]
MKTLNIRAHIIVNGRVQGVFFRMETYSKAKKENVSGWVRNRYDGRVEAIFEGKKENVEKMIKFCRIGPKGAFVDNIDVKWKEYSGTFLDFTISKTVSLKKRKF